MTNGGDPSLQIKTLGRFEVLIDGTPIPEDRWPRRRTKELLKVLLTDPGQPFTFDQLIDALLPEADVTTSITNIQARASELRRVLEPGLQRGRDSQYIISVREGYTFAPTCGFSLDTRSFEAGIREAERLATGERWQEATEAYEEAMLLYRGEFLAEDRYGEWAEDTRTHLREEYLQGLESLGKCQAQIGRYRQAISCCRRVLGVTPYRESVIRQLMEYESWIGQRTKALETFTEGARALREHLGVDPSPDMYALYETIERSVASRGDDLDPRRLAVLPFARFSADQDDDYIADGITEELIGHLSRIRDLRVLARTSVMRFKGTTRSIAPIARQLRVGTVLEGSICRVGGDIRVSAQLINAVSEEHLWAREFKGSIADLLAFQQDVAESVAMSLQVVLLSDEIRPNVSSALQTSEAYSLYLRGRFLLARMTHDENVKALNYFRKAIEVDGGLAEAYVGVARCCSYLAGWEVAGKQYTLSEGYTQAKRALQKALEIDPDSADAHSALGFVQAMFEHRFTDAETSYRRAIHHDPSNPETHVWYSILLMYMSRIDEALAESRCALDLDPVCAWCHVRMAFNLIEARRFEEARQTINQGIELDPHHSHLYDNQARMHWLMWKWEDARLAVEKYVNAAPYALDGPWSRGLHALYLGRIADSLAEFRGVGAPQLGDKRFRLALGLVLYHARKYEKLIALVEDLLCEDPFGVPFAGKSWLHLLRALALERLGKDEAAILALKEARAGLPEWLYYTFSRGPILAIIAEGLIGIRSGHQGQSLRALQQLARRSHENEVASALAILNFHLGRIDEGFEWLGIALDHHDEFILTIKTHPWFDPVRDDPRFAKVLNQMNLAD